MNSTNTWPTFINGEINTSLSLLDRGLAYGDGLFETIAWRNRRLELYGYHLERLLAGCERLRIPLKIKTLQNEVDRFVGTLIEQGVEEGVLKIIVTRGEGDRGYAAAENPEISRIIICSPLPDYPAQYSDQGIQVFQCDTVLARRPMLAGLKHLNRLEQVMAKFECRSNGLLEGLLSDSEGNLVEAISSNLFMVKNGKLSTPTLDQAGVAGVMRRFIMDDIAAQLNIETVQSTMTVDDLVAADEVFLTNSLIGLWPVTAYEDKRWPVGQLTMRIQDELKKTRPEFPSRPSGV